MTKADEIKKQYGDNNAKVEDKGDLIDKAVVSVGKMFRKKTIAVRCIANKAEKLAEEYTKTYRPNGNDTFEKELQKNRNNYTYYSSKYSTINGIPCADRSETSEQCTSFKIFKNPSSMYLPMTLTRDKHFFHIKVNTTHGSVHVPTNVFDGSNETKDVLIWSESLDEVFVQNYNADPALSWQYFGSETGVLRHYPAKSWQDRDTSSNVDVYDCRKRSWYIETATCSKDIVILLDKTGSMFGYLGFLAKLTIKSLLETFSNNDFFNIYMFSGDAKRGTVILPLVKCFEGKLMQATPENIEAFNAHMDKFSTEGYANASHIEDALEFGFGLLKEYQKIRKCDEKPCNQAIMLITDNIQGNFTKLFRDNNRKNGTNEAPVRVFTYLLGKDQSNVAEMKSIACSNRGAFAHIQTLDEVQEKVFDYVSTIALPLVLQGEKHPPTWTHAFKDVTYRDEESYLKELHNKETDNSSNAKANKREADKIDPNKNATSKADSEKPKANKKMENLPPRLMIAVGVPAYKIVWENDTRKYDGLLGVASTDVPVDDIDKLTLPYKLGVNAYPFIVSNNGFVLLHPDRRPMERFKMYHNDEIDDPQCKPNPDSEIAKTECVFLKNNYNSIDFTEVEQLDEEYDDVEYNKKGPRQYRPPIGNNLKQLRKLSLSHSKGQMLNVSVRFHYDKMRRASEEKYDYYFAPLDSTPFTLGLAIPSTYGQTLIKVGNEVEKNRLNNTDMSTLFVGNNWKVHPDWVYCKYHYMEYKSFNDSQEELLHFVQRFDNKAEEWKWSEQYVDDPNLNEDDENPHCEEKTDNDDSGYYCNRELVELLMFDAKVTNSSYGAHENQTDEAKQLIQYYNATLRFVATMSGLTRWQFIEEEIDIIGDREFGDYYTKAIDETWYRAAVLQHKADEESFVYTVPHDDKDDDKEDGNIKVMASHAIFRRDGDKEAPGCVVGFQFEQEEMYTRFKHVVNKETDCPTCLRCDDDLYDCYVIDNNGYIILSEDGNQTGRFFGEIEGRAMKQLVNLTVFKEITVYDYQAVCKQYDTVDSETSFGTILLTPFQLVKSSLQWLMMEIVLSLANINLWAWADTNEINKTVDADSVTKTKYKLQPCDKEATLYVMDQQYDLSTMGEIPKDLVFSRIKKSNLLLVAVEYRLDAEKLADAIGAEPKPIEYAYDMDNFTFEFPCHKNKLNDLERRRLDDCFTEDCRENDVITCSRSCTLHKTDQYLLVTLSVFLIISKLFRSVQCT